MNNNEGGTTRVDGLGQTLRTEFDEAASLRRLYEDEWIKSLRQVKGMYEPETQARMSQRDQQKSQRSKVFFRLTQVKCNAIKARLMDLLFPANGVDNFDISSTPKPTVREEAIKVGLEHFVMGGGDPNTLDMEKFVADIARDTCERMKTTMRDQLAETPTRQSYRKICDNMIYDAIRYGIGYLKGPLVETRTKLGYAQDETGTWSMQQVDDGLWPFFEYVPIWNMFPDMSATNKKQLRYVWQEHLMTNKELRELTRFPKFSADKISEYMRLKPEGDASLRQYETDIRSLSEDTTAPDLKGRYRVLERWGYLTGRELINAGIDIDPAQEDEIFSSNVWIVGNSVIKAVLNPLQGVDFPYFFYHFSKDESSFFGEGVPKLMRDCQSGVNAAARLLIDNAAMSSGPITGVNVRALAEGQDPREIKPWDVLLFDNAQDMAQCMQVWTLNSNSQDLTHVMQIFQEFADELTTPRYMYGDQKVGGAGSTASGLSMLMGAANISLKDLVKAFDDDITVPFVSALYHWNMQWNTDETIKGDYEVVATGSTSLIAKEVRAQQHQVLVGVTAQPRFAGMTKDQDWLKQIFKDADMPDTLVRSEEEYRQWQQEQAMMQAKAQSDALVQSLSEQAVKAGLDPQQAFMHIAQQIAPQLMQGQGQQQ